jgi:hypothetical protein
MATHSWIIGDWYDAGHYEGVIEIGDAALIAAGLPLARWDRHYRSPRCFSRPILAYAMALGNHMPHEPLQRLISFACRLSGTSDSEGIERARFNLIWVETCRQILAPLSPMNGNIETIHDVRAWAWLAMQNRHHPLYAKLGAAARFTLDGMTASLSVGMHYAVVATWGAASRCHADQAWECTFGILDRAIKLGRDEPVDAHLGSARLHAARQNAAAADVYNADA